MTLVDLDLFSTSIANLIDRIPSVKRDSGWSTALQLISRSPRTKALVALPLCGLLVRHPIHLLLCSLGRRPIQGIRKLD